MMEEQTNNMEPKITYEAVEISSGKIIAQGDDLIEVNKIAEASNLKFKINFIPNPRLSFVF